MDSVVTFFSENWEALSVIILWVASRVIKTTRNYDIFEMILKFIGDNIIPNRRSKKRGGGKIGLFFLLISSLFLVDNARGQTNGNFKSVRYVNAGSNEGNIPTSQNAGVIYYNEGTNTFRAFQNGVWQDLIGAGGGLTAADNGLSVSGGNTVVLGGSINQTATNINMSPGQILNINSTTLVPSLKNFNISVRDTSITWSRTANSIVQSFSISDNMGINFGDDITTANLLNGTFNISSSTGNVIMRSGTIATNLDNTGFTFADNNAAFTLIPSGFDINMTSGFGDLNMNADAFTMTGTTLTSGLGTTGAISLITGGQTSGGNSGLVSIATGDATTGLAGNIIIQPGTGAGGARGAIQMSSFTNTMSLPNGQIIQFASAGLNAAQIDCNENLVIFGDNSTYTSAPQATVNSGGTSLASGSVSGGSGASGDVQLITGNSVGGATGDIVITTGIGGGQDGSIRLQGRVANGVYIILEDLPVSAVGLPSGALWNNAGVLNIAP